MNRILRNSRYWLFLLLMLGLGTTFASEDATSSFVYSEEDIIVEGRINNLNSIIDVKYTKEVRDRIHNYVKQYPKGSERILARVSMYFPIIENEIRKRNLPDDIKYLAIVESALDANAYSKSGAAGLWQFMKGTGRMYGLKINSVTDQRRDAVRSTKAALDYLEDLHKQFGDWSLALAAYNCGPGNVRKAIRRSGGKRNYWEIRSFLPSETREYIPRHIAANYLMKYYYEYNLQPDQDELKFGNISTVEVFNKTNLSVLSQWSGLSVSDIKNLNPQYLRNYIPQDSKGNYLNLPASEMNNYVNHTGKHSDLVYFREMSSRAKARRTLEPIHLLPTIESSDYQRDMRMIFPVKVNLNTLSSSSAIRKEFYEYHKLRKRESIYDLVKIYEDVTFESIMQLNSLSPMEPPRVGTMIKIRRK